jgi:prolyl oligopeptidase
VRNVTDTYHGTAVDDPYRYFENFKGPQVQAWTRAEADYAQKTLRAIPGRDKLLARIQELDEGVPDRLSVGRRCSAPAPTAPAASTNNPRPVQHSPSLPSAPP